MLCVVLQLLLRAGTASVCKQRAFLALQFQGICHLLASGTWKQVAASMCPLGKSRLLKLVPRDF